MRPPSSAISGNRYIAGRRSEAARSYTICRFTKKSGVAKTLSAAAPQFFASSIAGAISSGVATIFVNSSTPTRPCRDFQFAARRLISIRKGRHAADAGDRFHKNFLPFAVKVGGKDAYSCRIAARPTQRLHKPRPNHIVCYRENRIVGVACCAARVARSPAHKITSTLALTISSANFGN